MQTEYEVKILDIDVKNIENRLKKIGAKKIKERNMHRCVYNLLEHKKDSWLRLRNNGEKTTLTLKEIRNDRINGTKEIEVVVDDFDQTYKILEKIGLTCRANQENKRISYKLKNVEIEIDFWPKIPPYLEIEAKSKKEIETIVKLLGFKMSQTTSIGVSKVYAKYGLDIDSFKILKFN